MYMGILPMCVSVHLMCVPGAHKKQKSTLNPWNWSYRGLLTAMWLLVAQVL